MSDWLYRFFLLFCWLYRLFFLLMLLPLLFLLLLFLLRFLLLLLLLLFNFTITAITISKTLLITILLLLFIAAAALLQIQQAPRPPALRLCPSVGLPGWEVQRLLSAVEGGRQAGAHRPAASCGEASCCRGRLAAEHRCCWHPRRCAQQRWQDWNSSTLSFRCCCMY